MSTEIATFHYGPLNLDVRVVDRNGDPWFVAVDLCRGYGLSNTTKAIKGLDDDEKSTLTFDQGAQQNHPVNIISEPGAYKLLARSNKPEAKPFQRWVFHEVLPSIRKTGSYNIGEVQLNSLSEDARKVVGGIFKAVIGSQVEPRRPGIGKMTMPSLNI